jgi:thiamine kinase-like enzyme
MANEKAETADEGLSEQEINRRDIEGVIAAIDDWKGKDVQYEQFIAGITNVNWKVTADGTQYFVKVYGKGTEEFMNREVSQAASRIAADAGAAPKVPYLLPNAEVFEWAHGYRTMDTVDFWDPIKLKQGMEGLRKVHDYPAELPIKETVFDQIRTLYNFMLEKETMIPEDIGRINYYREKIEEAVLKDGITWKVCENDTLAYNFLWNDEKQHMFIVDWETGSMNDYGMDMGTFASAMMFYDDQDRAMIEYYWGEFIPKEFARLKLYKIMADVKWGFWALAQNWKSTLRFDFGTYHNWKMHRMRTYWDDPRLEHWIQLLAG